MNKPSGMRKRNGFTLWQKNQVDIQLLWWSLVLKSPCFAFLSQDQPAWKWVIYLKKKSSRTSLTSHLSFTSKRRSMLCLAIWRGGTKTRSVLALTHLSRSAPQKKTSKPSNHRLTTASGSLVSIATISTMLVPNPPSKLASGLQKRSHKASKNDVEWTQSILLWYVMRSLFVIDRPLQFLHLVDGFESFNHLQVGDQHFFRNTALIQLNIIIFTV